MPNICSDDVYFFSETNPEGLTSLWYDLEASITLSHNPDDSRIGNILNYKGIDHTNLSLRGNVCYMERNESNILLCAETAWSPLYDAYTAIAQAYGIEFVMLSMEPGEDIYFNTDHSGIYFPDKYIVRMNDEDFITPSGIRLGEKIEHGETFTSVKGLLMRFEDVGYKARSLKSLSRMVEDDGIYIHKFIDPYQ